ncbi:hypothetical protein [Terasakiella sp. SH-1]|uniref:hypothetical protein n=1 Tax=Terasakiella sp. SH-1 TaxID=2560057 RepID=UPI001073E355|nr:hypothetical protein [Terasakiella sp. SH-1]
MKRNAIILTAISAIALAGITTVAIADDDERGWCPKGKYGKGGEYGRMHRGDGHGMGLGMMGGHHMGRFMKDGNFDLELTPERVKEIMEGKLAWHGNDNLKVGDVSTDKDGNIIAKLVTKDNSLVETFTIDPKTGAKRPLR